VSDRPKKAIQPRHVAGTQTHASLRFSRTARNFKAETQPGDAKRKIEEKKTSKMLPDKGGPESFVRSLRFVTVKIEILMYDASRVGLKRGSASRVTYLQHFFWLTSSARAIIRINPICSQSVSECQGGIT
jgi:hypothetical protein